MNNITISSGKIVSLLLGITASFIGGLYVQMEGDPWNSIWIKTGVIITLMSLITIVYGWLAAKCFPLVYIPIMLISIILGRLTVNLFNVSMATNSLGCLISVVIASGIGSLGVIFYEQFLKVRPFDED